MKEGVTAIMASLAVGAALLILAAYADSGTGWITLLGVDVGVSASGGNINISTAPGGFFHWWEAFAEMEYQPKMFGMGYDPLNLQDQRHLLPSFARGYKGRVLVAIFPVWMFLDAMAVWIALFSFRSTRDSGKEILSTGHLK